MTWTFDEDFDTVNDQIRQMIGDIISTDPLISDEAIAFFYARGGTLIDGAILAARSAAAKLALEFDKNLDGLSTHRSQRHKAMLDTIAQLEAEKTQSNFTFTVPEIGTIADEGNYPTEFEESDIAAADWDDSD